MSSSFSSLQLFTTKIPISLHPTKTLISPTKAVKFLSFYRPITFQKITTKPASVSAFASSSMDPQPVDNLPPSLQEIVKLFQSVQEPKAKYEQLLFYGKNLKPLDTQFKTSDNKVEGCVSQVWVRAYLNNDQNVEFEADSDSVLTKGLAALLVQGLSGRPMEEVLGVSPDFVVLLGLQQSLSRSRNNGFLNMLRLMQKKALELSLGNSQNSLGRSKSDDNGEDLSAGVSSQMGSDENQVRSSNLGSKIDDAGNLESGRIGESENGLKWGGLGSRRMRIREKLEKELGPVELQVEDISYQHAGHAGVRGSDGETHFNVRVVSKEFEGKSLVKRHRLVYQLLQEELQSGLHALSIVAKTPSEVAAR